MEVMIVIVCLDLQSSYDKIIVALCDDIQEWNKENQFDKNEYCDNVYLMKLANKTTDFEIPNGLISVFRCY